MVKRTTASGNSARVDAIRAEALVVVSIAEDLPMHSTERQKALSGARRLEAQATRMEGREDAQLLVLPDTATPAEVKAARVHRAVRRGDDVFLPSWSDAVTALPNTFLRSALFGAGKGGEYVRDKELVAQDSVTLRYTGETLTQYDQRIYAACLDAYRGDRPLSRTENGTWIRRTFYEFAKEAIGQHSPGVYKSLRAALLRLASGNLRVRVGRLDVPIPKLVEVAFSDGIAEDNVLGSDEIAFRVTEQVANLFGLHQWSKVDGQIARFRGLASWLASFYSSHSAPHPVPLETLYRRSASGGDLSDFKRNLQNALTKLSGDDVPDALRVLTYTIAANNAVIVHLARWKNAKLAAPKAA